MLGLGVVERVVIVQRSNLGHTMTMTRAIDGKTRLVSSHRGHVLVGEREERAGVELTFSERDEM